MRKTLQSGLGRLEKDLEFWDFSQHTPEMLMREFWKARERSKQARAHAVAIEKELARRGYVLRPDQPADKKKFIKDSEGP